MSTTYYAGYINTIPNDKQSFQSSYSASTVHNSRWLLPHSCGQQIHSDPESKVIYKNVYCKVTNSSTSWLLAPALNRKVSLRSDFAPTKFHFCNSIMVYCSGLEVVNGLLHTFSIYSSTAFTHCSRIDLYKILFPGTFFTFLHSYIMGTI